MIGRKFWDSDRLFRHNVVYKYLESCEYNIVLSNNEPPRINIGRLKKYFNKISNMIYGSEKGSIDLDVLAYNKHSLVVGEVKTRLIPRIFRDSQNLEIVRKFIGYHVSNPIVAKKIWDYLKNTGRIQKHLDNEASISELGKELLGIIARDDIRKLLVESKKMYVGLFTLDMLRNTKYYNELLRDIYGLVEWFKNVIKDKTILDNKYIYSFIVLFKPKEYVNNCTPRSFTIKVLGSNPCPNNLGILNDIY